MSKITSVFYFVFIYGLATEGACFLFDKKPEVAVSFSTFRSDLELILAEPLPPSKVKIVYNNVANPIHLSVNANPSFRNLEGQSPRHIQIEEDINIKHKDGSVAERKRVVFVNYAFLDGFDGHALFTSSPEQERTTYMILKPNSQKVDPTPAQRTIHYTPITQLTKELNTIQNEMKKKYTTTNTVNHTLSLGSSETLLTYNLDTEFLHLKKPLKGISLSTNQVQPHIFCDVWYNQHSKVYGSSSRSFQGIDAVRIYENRLNQREDKGKTAEQTTSSEEIRKKVFEVDMNNAFVRLQDDQFRYTNAFLIYGSNIVLEVRARQEKDKKYVEAIGTTMADTMGRGSRNVNASYDHNELKYSDQLNDNTNFIPSTSKERSYFLMYTAVDKLERHLKALWAAMQGGCDNTQQIYRFSIFYGQSIKVKYFCDSRNILMEENHSFTMRAVSKSGKTIVNECRYLRYSETHHLEIKQCTEDDAAPIAIFQEPQQMWLNDVTPTQMKTELLIDDLKHLKNTLIEKRKGWGFKPTIGTSLLDGKRIFEMHLPSDTKNSNYAEVFADFRITAEVREGPDEALDFQYAKLDFSGDESTAFKGNSRITIDDKLKYMHYIYKGDGRKKYVIQSAYLTTKQLQESLNVASTEASIRCKANKNKSYLVKLVHQYKFALDGSYDCSEKVFLFKGNFKALILSKTDQNTEILTQRPITNFIYVTRDKFFLPGTESFNDVYAISLPEMKTDFIETLKLFGSPQTKDLLEHTELLFKSKEL